MASRKILPLGATLYPRMTHRLKGGEKVQKGDCIVRADGSQYAQVMKSTLANAVFLGFAVAEADATAYGDAVKTVDVLPQGSCEIAVITGATNEADSESDVYFSDSITATLTSTGNVVKVGNIQTWAPEQVGGNGARFTVHFRSASLRSA